MKSILQNFTTFLFCSVFVISIKSYAQGSINNSSWAKKFEYQKSFIENKGQFTIPNSFGNTSEVLFAVDHGGTKIYFTKKGITYALLETFKKPKDAREIERERKEEFRNPEEHMRHEKEEHELKVKADQVSMLWQNANPNVEIEASELTSDYHNYYFKQANGEYKNVSNIKGFKKINYKNIYPNIDVEYVFSEKGGLKYSVTLRPGADPSLVKMVYDAHISLKANGDIHIDTKFGDIIDHAPLTFYQSNTSSVINSAFIKSGKTISFQLSNYDNTKTVVIDPWTQTPAFASNWDCIWECEKDGAGNVYVIGGVTPLQLLKYNAAGVIQWTYNTPYDTTSWLGTFATDNVGNSYVTRGSVSGIQKVSTAGALIWNNNGGGSVGNSDEYWNIAFNCDQTKLIVGGTAGAFGLPPALKGAIFDINTTNGAILATKIVAYGSTTSFPPSIQEVRSITPCGNGRYYFLTLDSIGYINQNFTLCGSNSAVVKTTSSHGFSYKCENYRSDNTGIMAIRADLNFVYTHNGTTLFKRSLSNAAIIASVAIPGGAATTSLGQKVVSCSGLDIDAAGNIYVGSTNAVTKFSPALVQLATVAVPFAVYDVHVSTGGEVIACGSTGNSGTASRTGYVQSISSLAASNTLSLTCCDVNICQPANVCTTASAFNLTAATPGGIWGGTGITNASTGTFNPATAGAGSYIITYSLACGVGSVNVNVITCGTVSVCINSGSLTANGGSGVGTYTWASTTTSVDCSGCFGGTCSFLCAGVTVPSWTATGTTVATPPSGVFPIKVTDTGSGVTYTFTTLASIPACSTPSCPTLTMAVTSQTNVNCFGASTATAAISASGGNGSYTYTWSPGNLSGSSQSALAAGTYTIAIKDGNTCTGTGTLTITQPAAALNAVISATTTTGCGTSVGGATVTASGGTSAYTYSWTPSGGTTAGVSNLGSGNNTVTVTDSKGCITTAIANISTSGGPALSVVSQTNVNCFGANTGTATVNASGGTGSYSYTWSPGNLNGASQTALSAGTYTINVTDAGLCTGTNTLIITQPTTALSAVITATTPSGCGASTGGATVTANGGTPSYTYNWAPSGGTTAGVSNLAAGGNTVTVTDSKGCTVTTVANITSAGGGSSLSVTSQTNVNCFGANTGSATVNAVGGSGPYTYTWSPGNLTGASHTGLGAGIYTISITDASACVGSGTISITQPTTALSAIISNSPTGCGTSVGSATVNAGGGTPSYTYSWSSPGGSSTVISNLAVGNYSVTVTDSKGCQTTSVTNISSSASGPTLSISSQTNLNCNGASNGAATVNASGAGAPYSYTWSPVGGNAANANGLSAGVYTVFVGYGSSCVSTITVSISQPIAISVSLTTTPASCGNYDGTATLIATGGNGSLTQLWSVNSNSSTINGLSAGIYSVVVTDASGCSVSSSCYVSSSGTLAVNASGGTTIYAGESAGLTASVPSGATVVWSPSVSLSCSNCLSTIASPSLTTTYTVTASSGGCTGTSTVTIFIDIKCGELFIPSAFSPNDDGQNDMLFVMGNCIEHMEFVIFDRWGEKVFVSTDPAFGWDGTFNGKKLDPAAFAYYIKATVDGEEVIQKGSISIVK